MKKVMLAVGKLTGGGAERVATVWANQLSLLGCSVSMLSLFCSDHEYPLRDDVIVYRIAESRQAFARMSFAQKYRAFRKIFRSAQPDYVIAFLPYIQKWVMLTTPGLGIKRIDTVRNNLNMESFPNPLHRLLWRLSYCTCNKIILQSRDQAIFLSSSQQKKCTVIPNPVDDIYLQSCKSHVSACPQKFVAVGRIHAQKNYPMMIKGFSNVCRHNPNLTLHIYGTGTPEYVKSIEDLIAAEGMTDRIILMGRVNHIEQEYLKHDVFLMTSDYEGMPNALAEAMASKLICISTDCQTGPRDLIDNETNGYLVPVSDVERLQQAIEHVLNSSSEELEQIALRAREKILTYCSKENSTQQLLHLINSAP